MGASGVAVPTSARAKSCTRVSNDASMVSGKYLSVDRDVRPLTGDDVSPSSGVGAPPLIGGENGLSVVGGVLPPVGDGFSSRLGDGVSPPVEGAVSLQVGDGLPLSLTNRMSDPASHLTLEKVSHASPLAVRNEVKTDAGVGKLSSSSLRRSKRQAAKKR